MENQQESITENKDVSSAIYPIASFDNLQDEYTNTLRLLFKQLLEISGFKEPNFLIDKENAKINIFLNETEWFKRWVPELINDFNHLSRTIAHKKKTTPIFIDINNYRKERENIITNLAKAAARKVVMNKESVRLPAMNAYERRLIHTELAARPDIITESEGEGVLRCVVVKPSQL